MLSTASGSGSDMPGLDKVPFRRILFAGDFVWPFYDAAMAGAIEELGFEVQRFSWASYFQALPSLLARVSRRLLGGPAMGRLNADLLQMARASRPDVVIIQRGVPVWASTVRALRQGTPAVVVAINQDDPLAPRGSKLGWRHFRNAIPHYDVHFVCRQVNIEEFRDRGARAVCLLRQYYVPAMHRPMQLTEEDRRRWSAAVVFAGHYEADGRLGAIERLLEAGIEVKVHGSLWPARLRGRPAQRLLPIRPVYDAEYAKALAAARICLCFFSRVNRDEVTTRCFEIPAIGSFLLAERTPAMQALFEEGKEAAYFSSPEELVEKVQYYLNHDAERCRIAEAGRRRCLRDGHDVKSRMGAMLAAVAGHV